MFVVSSREGQQLQVRQRSLDLRTRPVLLLALFSALVLLALGQQGSEGLQAVREGTDGEVWRWRLGLGGLCGEV